ncbi:MAG: choice-of-anchor P family protein, partial [Candidatus Binatia bacterium]
VTAQGRARSSTATLLGTDVGLLTTGDTQLQTETEPGTFSVVVPGTATVDVPGVASVISGASTTTGSANSTNSFVISTAGEVTADVLNGTVQVVTTGAQAAVSCDGATASAQVEALMIGNEAIDVPLNPQPNQVVEVAGVARVILNRQNIVPNLATRSVSAEVDAVVIEVLSGGQLLEVVLSSAAAALANLPASCPVIGGDGDDDGDEDTTGGGDGGGGCALNPSAPSIEAWPIFLLTLLWILHRRRRMLTDEPLP